MQCFLGLLYVILEQQCRICVMEEEEEGSLAQSSLIQNIGNIFVYTFLDDPERRICKEKRILIFSMYGHQQDTQECSRHILIQFTNNNNPCGTRLMNIFSSHKTGNFPYMWSFIIHPTSLSIYSSIHPSFYLSISQF